MRLQISNTLAPAGWDAAVIACGGSVFHSSAWAEFVTASSPNVVASFLTLQDDTRGPVAHALAFSSRSPVRLFGPWSGRMWLDALPIVIPGAGEAVTAFLTLLEHEARARHVVELHVGSYASHDTQHVLERLGYEVRHRFEFTIPLDASEPSLWNALGPQPRNQLRKAERLGVVVNGLCPDDGVVHLRRLQAASAERIVRRGGPLLELPPSSESDPLRTLLASGHARIFAARLREDYVSAGLFTLFNGLVYYHLGGHSTDGLRCQAPTLLLWEAIRRYRSVGARVFNLGGCGTDAVAEQSPEHGVYRYKRALSANCATCTSGTKVLRTTVHRIVRGLRQAVRA